MFKAKEGLLGASQVLLVIKNLPANAGDLRDKGSLSGSGRSPGGGHGNPLQYSCLENPMDRGAWWAVVHKVRKSGTWPKWLGTPQGSLEAPICSWLVSSDGSLGLLLASEGWVGAVQWDWALSPWVLSCLRVDNVRVKSPCWCKWIAWWCGKTTIPPTPRQHACWTWVRNPKEIVFADMRSLCSPKWG